MFIYCYSFQGFRNKVSGSSTAAVAVEVEVDHDVEERTAASAVVVVVGETAPVIRVWNIPDVVRNIAGYL
jgi:hypothetical protein